MIQLDINDDFFKGASTESLKQIRQMLDRVLSSRDKGEEPRLDLPTEEALMELGSTHLTGLIERATAARRHCDMLADVEVLAIWRHDGKNLPIFPDDLDAALLHFTVETVLGEQDMRALVKGLWDSNMRLSKQVEEAFQIVEDFLRQDEYPYPDTPIRLTCATDLGGGVICC